MATKKNGLVCVSNPVIDACALVDDAFLEKWNLPKGSAPHIPPEQIHEISNSLEFVSVLFGGSGVNTTKALGLMGIKVALIGQYSNDSNGEIVKESMKRHNIRDLCTVKEGHTTRINIYVTPDKQRTMTGLFGVSHEERLEPFDPSVMDEYEYLLNEGYHFCNQPLRELAWQCTDYAYENGIKAVLSLSNIFCVDSFKDAIRRVASKSFIISGNDEEFLSLFEMDDLDKLIDYLAENEKERIFVITQGAKGACVIDRGVKYTTEAPDVAKEDIADVTGAGDHFIAGFLYGHMMGYKVTTSLKIANLFCQHIITKIGVDLPESVKEEVAEIVKNEER